MNISGDRSRNIIQGEPMIANNFNVNFRSTECELSIGPECDLSGLEINFNKPGQKVVFSGKNLIRGQIYLTASGVGVFFGKRTRTNSAIWMNLAEANTNVKLGADCLLASVRFRTSDSHKIFDVETGERINPPDNIEISERVWIAEDVLLLRGASIGAGSVVGARSMVNGPLPANALCAGTPARVLRQGIRWEP